jgi:hypothetical protein
MIDAMIGIFFLISFKMVWAVHDYDHFSQQHIWTNIYLNVSQWKGIWTINPGNAKHFDGG